MLESPENAVPSLEDGAACRASFCEVHRCAEKVEVDFEIYRRFRLLIPRCQLDILQVCVLGGVQLHACVADITRACETNAERCQPLSGCA